MIRVATIGAPLFQHDGLVVHAAWTELDVAKLEPKVRKALVDFTGHVVQIHPDDIGKLAELGLEQFVDSRLGRTCLREAKRKPKT